MSSKSKSSTSQSTSTVTEDSRVAADGGAIVVSNNSEATFVDPGAIALTGEVLDKVIGAAEGAFEISQQAVFDSLGFVQQNVRDTNAIVEKVNDQARSEETQILSQLIKIGVPLFALVLIIRSVNK